MGVLFVNIACLGRDKNVILGRQLPEYRGDMLCVYSLFSNDSWEQNKADEEAGVSEENISDLHIEERHMPGNFIISSVCL